MAPDPIISASTRHAACTPLRTGPSCTQRTSRTLPWDVPSAATTSLPRRSLIRIVPASRDVADDVVADPALGAGGRHAGAVEGQVDARPDRCGQLERDAVGPRRIGRGTVARQPGPQPSAVQAVRHRPGPGDDRGQPPVTVVVDEDVEVVDLAALHPVAIAQLAVEQVERHVDHPSGHHWPALVMMISGIVATATTARMTR